MHTDGDRTTRIAYIAALCIAVLALATPSSAQPVAIALQAGVTHSTTNWRNPVTTIRAEGAVGAVGAELAIGRLGLGVSYSDGRLHTGGRAIGLGGGAIAVALRLSDALELRAGPAATVLRADSSVTRWIEWRGALRLTSAAGAWGARSHLEFAAARATRADIAGSSLGADAGLTWRVGNIDVGVEYGMHELRLPAAERLTIERLGVVLSLRP